jgi:hypothetical protein
MNRERDRQNLHPRLARTIALVPLILGMMLGAYVAFAFAISGALAPSVTSSPFYAYAALAIAVGAVPVIGYGGSLFIWWPTFRHHPRRRAVALKVTIAYLAALSPGLVLSFVPGAGLGVLLSIVLGLLGCGVAVIVINRKLAAPSRVGGVIPCLRCGYDMRGQQECRCPECGAQFTVGELVISPPGLYI